MNKADLIDKISQKSDTTKKQSDAVLSAAIEVIMDTVSSGEKVTLVGFGSFEPRKRTERIGRNPQTGAELKIPATVVPGFSAGKVFKEKVAS